jgi:hypothetical protein
VLISLWSVQGTKLVESSTQANCMDISNQVTLLIGHNQIKPTSVTQIGFWYLL